MTCFYNTMAKDTLDHGPPGEDADIYSGAGLPQPCIVKIPRVIHRVHIQSCPAWLTQHFVTARRWKHRVWPWNSPRMCWESDAKVLSPECMCKMLFIPFKDYLVIGFMWNTSSSPFTWDIFLTFHTILRPSIFHNYWVFRVYFYSVKWYLFMLT